jgi:hypothetical protein
MTLRHLVSLAALLAAGTVSGCLTEGGGGSSPTSVPAEACFQHPTIGYRVCYPGGWVHRDYTSEPGGGGALSVVGFGPSASVPEHVPAQGDFTPPVEIRIVSGGKASLVPSLTKGNQVSQATIAGSPAERILVTQEGPAKGAIIVVIEHQPNTYVIRKAPGTGFESEFDKVLASFTFARAG